VIALADYEKKEPILSMEVPDMLRYQIAKFSIASICVICAGIALAEDFAGYSDEGALLKTVKSIPASDRSANAAGYARLLALNPNSNYYWTKFERYSGSDESALLRVVRGIPASNKSANAAGYLRLLALDPNNDLYQAKFEKYSGQSKRLKSVSSASDLGRFLVGSWCLIDDSPTYVSGPYVEKLVVTKDGSYTLFSKQAAAMVWEESKAKGKFTFREGRYPSTGGKYFSATPDEYKAPTLLVNANDFSVAWQRGIEVGGVVENGCGKFE
jgi:hypothetical protein